MLTTLKKVSGLFFLFAALILLCFGLCACSEGATSESQGYETEPTTNLHDTSGGVASTVNDVEIGENVITAYVDLFRSASDLESDDDWAEFMIENGYESVEDIRESVIDYYDELELVIQAADANKVTVESTDVDEEIQSARDYYESYGEDFEEALASQGFDEPLYTFVVYLSLLQEATMDKLADEGELGDLEADDAQVLEAIQSTGSADGAWRSSHILFDAGDEELAQEVLDKIKSGEITFEDAAKEYSTDGSASDGGDIGWTSQGDLVDEYQTALENLKEGEISDLVTSDYGIHIIKCTGIVDPVEGGEITSLDQISSDDYIEYFRDEETEYNKQEAYSDWMTDYEEKANIDINDDIDVTKLSYYVDLSSYEEDEGTDDSTESSLASSSSDSTGSSDSSSASTGSSESDSTEDSGSSADSSSAADSSSDSASSSASSSSESESASSSAASEATTDEDSE